MIYRQFTAYAEQFLMELLGQSTASYAELQYVQRAFNPRVQSVDPIQSMIFRTMTGTFEVGAMLRSVKRTKCALPFRTPGMRSMKDNDH